MPTRPTRGSTVRRERIRSGFGCAFPPTDQSQRYRKNRGRERSNRSAARQDRAGNLACRLTGYEEWREVRMLFVKGSGVRSLTRILEFRPLASYLTLRSGGRISASASLNPPFCCKYTKAWVDNAKRRLKPRCLAKVSTNDMSFLPKPWFSVERLT